MAKKKPITHCGLFGKEVACFHCGTRIQIIPDRGGMPITMVAASLDSFAEIHRGCRETPESPTLKLEANEWAWERGLFVGSSSATIFFVLAGRPPYHIERNRLGTLPRDPDDFSRCHRLLRINPEWRARLGEVAAKYPAWAPLVEHWDELTAMFERKDPGMYDRMQALNGEAS